MKKFIAFLFIFLFSYYSEAQSKKEIEKKIISIASASGLDPDVVLAIATVESSLNPLAVGALNEQGLFQLRPEFHPVIIGNAEHNILVGVAYLLELKTKFSKKYGNAWFVMFNYGPYNPPSAPAKTKYYQKVMTEVNKLKFKRYLVML